MAITLRTSNSGTALNGGDPTCSLTGVQEGDVIVAITGTSFDTGGDPSGYTRLVQVTASGILSLNVSYLVAGASPPSSVTGVGSGDPQDAAAIIAYVLTGVDTASVSDATPTNGTAADPPAITTTTDDAWVITAVGLGEQDASPGANDGSNAIMLDAADDFAVTLVASTYEVATAGSLDPSTFTLAAGTKRSVTVAISPAATEQQIPVGLAWY